jgi:hypothetical protein
MDDNPSQFLSIEVVYRDEHLIQLEIAFAFAEWSARAKGYSHRETASEFVEALEKFTKRLSGEVIFEDGSSAQIGFLCLKFYTTGTNRRLYCHLKLIGEPLDPREGIVPSMVSVELPLEAAALDVFVPALRRVIETQSGKATLRLSRG